MSDTIEPTADPVPADTAKPWGPPLEMLAEVAAIRDAEIAAIEADPRPRTIDVSCTLGEFRFRRWSPEQIDACEQRLRKAGIEELPLTASNVSVRGHLIKSIQIGLTGTEDNNLAFPGQKGFDAIGKLPNEELERLANQALQFNEVFNG